MDKIAEFVLRKRTIKEPKKAEIKEVKVPWYKRPIERTAFSYREAKDGNLYVQHNEWNKNVWIGPYKSKKDVDDIVNSYVMESLKAPLDRKQNNKIHSITINNEEEFFVSKRQDSL